MGSRQEGMREGREGKEWREGSGEGRGKCYKTRGWGVGRWEEIIINNKIIYFPNHKTDIIIHDIE